MKEKIQYLLNIILIILMPIMRYVTISETKINLSMADFLLFFVGILLLINIKKIHENKRSLLIVYFVGLLLSLLLSQYIGSINKEFLWTTKNVMLMEMIKTVIVAVYFFAAFIFINNEKIYINTIIAISLSSLPVFAIGISAYIYKILDKEFIIKGYIVDRRLRFLGTFKDPNLCALYFIVVFFISIINFKTIENIYLKILMLLITLSSLMSIILTMSRGGWLGISAGIVVLLVLNIKNLKKESVLAVLGIIVVLLSLLSYDLYELDSRLSRRIIARINRTISQDIGDIGRVELSRAAFEMGNDNFLFGVGKGAFPLNSYKYLGKEHRYYKNQMIPHNTILGFYAQQGILGVIIFSTLPIYILYLMIKSKRRQNIYYIALLSAIAVQSMTINIENVRFVWYVLGVMLVGERENFELEFTEEIKMKTRSYMITVAILLIAIIGLLYKIQNYGVS